MVNLIHEGDSDKVTSTKVPCIVLSRRLVFNPCKIWECIAPIENIIDIPQVIK